MSRLIVKNLPRYLDDVRLRKHFESLGQVTDAQVLRLPSGKSRRFGFVGFKTADVAAKACEHFNKTFIDTTRIVVEVAKKVGDAEIARPWSKYSEGSSAHTKKHKKKAKSGAGTGAGEGDSGGKKQDNLPENVREARDMLAQDPEFAEFSQLMQPRVNKRTWADEQGAVGVSGGGVGRQAEEPPAKKSRKKEKTEKKEEAKKKKKQKQKHTEAKEGDVGSAAAESDLAYMKRWQAGGDAKAKETAQKEADPDKEHAGERKEPPPRPEDEEEKYVEEEEEPAAVLDADRLFVRNLPQGTSEEELMEFMEAWGEVKMVHIPTKPPAGSSSEAGGGLGFVTFAAAANAEQALLAADGRTFQGRVLKVTRARQRDDAPEGDVAGLSFKERRERERQGKAANARSWSTLFLSTEGVVGRAAEKLGVDSASILDRSASDMAVRVALGETSAVAESKAFLESEGVDVSALSGGKAVSGSGVKRSRTVILIKNLPGKKAGGGGGGGEAIDENAIGALFSKHGQVRRVALAPSKLLAVVEFEIPGEARTAFRFLAYSSFHGSPLYLEWAPEGPGFAARRNRPGAQTPAGAAAGDEEEEAAEEEGGGASLFVKNLNFATTEKDLEKHFSGCRGMRSCTVVTKGVRSADGTVAKQSRGFGFAEFASKSLALAAERDMDGSMLAGHRLQLKLAHTGARRPAAGGGAAAAASAAAAAAGGGVGGAGQRKIVVNNVPFQATRKEIRDLFSACGVVKAVRLPKRFDGTSRGFAFIEFISHQEAAGAMAKLSSTHLYGRHLVLGWAEDAEEDAETGGDAA